MRFLPQKPGTTTTAGDATTTTAATHRRHPFIRHPRVRRPHRRRRRRRRPRRVARSPAAASTGARRAAGVGGASSVRSPVREEGDDSGTRTTATRASPALEGPRAVGGPGGAELRLPTVAGDFRRGDGVVPAFSKAAFASIKPARNPAVFRNGVARLIRPHSRQISRRVLGLPVVNVRRSRTSQTEN